jgi:hypothetical protein
MMPMVQTVLVCIWASTLDRCGGFEMVADVRVDTPQWR